ncbi:MAG: LysM peptidoglycan-binding domain-containing protein [Clostridia bacterium]|nr:LysM peptidoglycan-binding domain-containing protein [Clostridia bacterium]
MAVQPNYEELKFYGEETYRKQTEVECKINVTGEIKTVLAVTGTAYPVGEEITGGDIRYGGRVTFCVLYETPDGNPAKAECGVEFSDKYENAQNANSVKFTEMNVIGAEVRYLNGGYVAQAVVSSNITVNTERSANILTGGEGVLCDFTESEMKIQREFNRVTLQADDEFDLNYSVKDVLLHTATIYVSSLQCGIGAVILEGTLFLSMTLLQNNEKNVIVKENRIIPVRLEAEMNGASPEMQACALAKISKSSIKVVVDEEKQTSTVIASFDIDSFCCIYDIRPIKYARDAYSPKNEVSVGVTEISNRYVSAQYGISEKILVPSDCVTDDGAEIVVVTGETVENVTIDREAKSVTGVISATVIEKTDGGYAGKRAVAPFEIPFGVDPSVNYALEAAVENFTYRLREKVELEATLKIRVTEKSSEEYKAVSELAVGEEKEEKTTAISVYVAKGNDTLWDVCKKTGVSAETIAELNPDVTFPLGGKERIIIYRNL